MDRTPCYTLAAFFALSCLSHAAPLQLEIVDGPSWALPPVGSHQLRIIAPTLLELTLINSKPPDPGRVGGWDLVDTNLQFRVPPLEEFLVVADGETVPVQSVGFKRRPLYAPLRKRDLRIANQLYLRLTRSITDGQTVEVRNPSAALWQTNLTYRAKADALRYSPVIHVNQAGYVPAFPKAAMVGYYLGSLGELSVPSAEGFKLIDHYTGSTVFEGPLLPRRDVGYPYSPRPYQNVWEADFSNFATPGEYRLVVPGLGASWPFRIDEGSAMAFARAYALGIYHQRCGTSNALPFTRFTHGSCHIEPAEVPDRTFAIAQRFVADASADFASNPRHTAPRLKDFDSSLYPFVNKGRLDVAGGHHDAGDYSKYTINSAGFVHVLMFAVDAFPKAAELDNLGLPESGDRISDLLQEAKWEADFLAKMQDADGGFYFLVYPRNRAYESDVLPERGDPQIVWPKNTSATAAGVAALAQCASSPHFRKHYPEAAELYFEKALKGWKFLTNAVAKYGKDGSYQKLISYGNEFMHDDELAWAACELYLATGQEEYHQQLRRWFDPASSATWRWSWWRMFESYGNAIRSYAFAARTGRLATNQLNTNFLAACERQILFTGSDVLNRSRQNAYGTSFPAETKRVRSAGWYFSTDQAFDLAVASLLKPDQEFVRAYLYNLNYEGGCNPVNVCYVTGLGLKRQTEIVHHYALNDARQMPPSGLPLGNIQDQFPYLDLYGGELGKLTFPSDGATYAPYPFYDRWADTFNVSTEFTIVNQARSLAGLALLVAQTELKHQGWQPVSARITGLPAEVGTNVAVTARLEVPGMNLEQANIVWEASSQGPGSGFSFTFIASKPAPYWVEAEAQWPDGRRVFAEADVVATNGLPIVTVVATDADAAEGASNPGVFAFTRRGSVQTPLTVRFQLAGTATGLTDYRSASGTVPDFIVIPADATTATLELRPVDDAAYEVWESIVLTLTATPSYVLGTQREAFITIRDNDPRVDPASFLVQPRSQEVPPGADVVFRVEASGTKPLSYQWRYNGLALPGATTDVLALTNVQPASAGKYSVVVRNSAGSITSTNAVLNVKPPAEPADKPPSISPIPNQKSTMNTPTSVIPFTVNSEATPAAMLKISRHSSNPVLVPAENILFSGSEAGWSLVIVPAGQQSGTTAITITVTDDRGLSASASFLLEISPAPGDQPVLSIAPFGDQIQLSWPTNAMDFAVEAAETLREPANWFSIAAFPIVVGGRFLLTIQKTGTEQFFRLKQSTAAAAGR
ncbi:MAG: glycoside hydrolase family 9 protein [Verrucomicrobia bacterium]|nr:glycoside hydrolase family 9 protein [Verrucomicrobiota bacterium]